MKAEHGNIEDGREDHVDNETSIGAEIEWNKIFWIGACLEFRAIDADVDQDVEVTKCGRNEVNLPASEVGTALVSSGIDLSMLGRAPYTFDSL